jgi:hypothetical protein
VQSLILGRRATARLLERTGKRIARAQRRNAAARRSHTKRTKRRLHAIGIRLTGLPRCQWDKS